MSDRISIESVPNIPTVNVGDNVGQIIVDAIRGSNLVIEDDNVLCIASKIISLAEERVVSLDSIQASDLALQLHETLPRKDPRTIQAIIDQTGVQDASRLEIKPNYIGGWLPNGLFLTSAGVDKMNSEEIILLPEDADSSARVIGKMILESTGVRVGIIITDSDGRVDKMGSTQVAIGVYGVPALRQSESVLDDGITKQTSETLCDMLAATAALLMGQRGVNKPVVILRGVDYQFQEDSSIRDALNANHR